MRVAVDLRPVQPRGVNGGARVLAEELVRGLGTVRPDWTWTLLTAPWNHDDLAGLDGPNVGRVPAVAPPDPPAGGARRDPGTGVRAALRRWWGRRPAAPDVFLCPFSAPDLAPPGVPTVCIAYDLQHRDMPAHFDPAERAHRDRYWTAMRERAAVIACISEFTRERAAHFFGLPDAQAVVIHPAVHARWAPAASSASAAVRGLPERYAFFPANYWPHKNHQRLLEAYARYRRAVTAGAMDLVFTGALAEPEAALRRSADGLGLGGHVHFAGYVTQSDLAAIWRGARALVYPSLYEGFGIPLVEAMWFEVPMAVARAGSLPEVAGDAALYFDPTDVADLAEALAAVDRDEVRRAQLTDAGRRRRTAFAPDRMLAAYAATLERAAKVRPR